MSVSAILDAMLVSSAPEASPTLTPREAAALVGVSDGTIRRWLASGDLDGVRVGGRLRIERQALEQVVRPAAESTP